VNKSKPPKRLIFAAGNYAHRVDGAVFIRIGDEYIYFHEQHVIGIRSDGVLYRSMLNGLKTNTTEAIYRRRLRQAMQGHSSNRNKDVSTEELRAMAEAILMRATSKLVDLRLGIDLS